MKGLQEYTVEELQKRAASYFDKREKMIVTSDGNFFYEEFEHAAVSHAKENKLQIYTLNKEVKKATPKPKNESVKGEIKDEHKNIK